MNTITPQAKRFQIILKELKKSNRAFAAEAETSEGTIRRMKSGERELSYEVMRHVCLKYGYSAEWLVMGLGDKKLTGQHAKLVTEIQLLRTEIDIVVQLNKQMNARMTGYEKENDNLRSELQSLKDEIVRIKKTG